MRPARRLPTPRRSTGFDAHDGHPLTKGHAGCGAIAGLLAFAGDGSRMSGAEALGHLVLGYEVAIRAGIALHATAAEYHTSGAWVSLGVAAIGARILGLDAAATREALGIAEYNGPRSQMMRCIDHPTMIKDGSGWGAMTGAAAVCLAREGFTGAPAITVEGDDVAGFWSDMGDRWRINEQYFKAYPVCRWAQPAIEAAAQLQRDHRFGHGDIEGITVRTFHEAYKLSTAEPPTPMRRSTACRFRSRRCWCAARSGPTRSTRRRLATPTYCGCRAWSSRSTIRAFRRCFRPSAGPRWNCGWRTAGCCARSRRWRAAARKTRCRTQEISDKFHELMRAGGLAYRARAIEDMVMGMDKAASFAPLVDALRQPPEAVELAGAAE